MEDLYHQLETHIRKLISQYEQMRQENASLSQEKELLLAKHKVAITQIQNMVSHLKSVERA